MPPDSTTPSPDRPSRSAARKVLFALIPGLVLLFALEGGLRLYHAASGSPWFEEQTAKGLTTVTFKGGAITHKFPARKAPGTFRVFCLGASTIQGYHLAGVSTVPLRLERVLNDAPPPGQRFEVINLGVMGATSREVLEIFRESLAYDSDLYILYLGHNELGIGLAPNLLRNTRLGPAAEWLRDHSALVSAGLGGATALLAGRELTRPGVTLEVGDDSGFLFTDRARELGAERFGRNLTALAEAAKSGKREVWFATVIGDEADHAPAKSVFSKITDPKQRAEIHEQTLKAEAEVVAGRPAEAEEILTEVLAAEPDYAMAHFDLGRARLEQGKAAEAGQDFVRALELDDFPLRATPAINQVIRRVAADQGLQLLDLHREFRERGVAFDRRLFYDHVHLTIHGQQLVTDELARRVLTRTGAEVRELPSQERINQELAVPREVLASLNLMHGLFVGCLSDRPFYLSLAGYFFGEAEKYGDDPLLPNLARGFVALRAGDPGPALQQWPALLGEHPRDFIAVADRFFAGDIITAGGYVLVDPEGSLAQVGDFQANLAKGPQEVTTPELKPAPGFLERFDFFFRWDDEARTLSDESSRFRELLQARRRELTGRAPREVREFIDPLAPGASRINALAPDAAGAYRAAGPDPWFVLAPLAIDPLLSREIEIVMKVEGPASETMAELYWRGAADAGFSERRKFTLPVRVGEESVYRVPVGALPSWIASGTVTGLRLDPMNAPGLSVTVKSIRIIPFN